MTARKTIQLVVLNWNDLKKNHATSGVRLVDVIYRWFSTGGHGLNPPQVGFLNSGIPRLSPSLPAEHRKDSVSSAQG